MESFTTLKSVFIYIFSWLLLQLYGVNYTRYSDIDFPPPPVFTEEIEKPAICLVMKKVVPFQWTTQPSAFTLLNKTDLPLRQFI